MVYSDIDVTSSVTSSASSEGLLRAASLLRKLVVSFDVRWYSADKGFQMKNNEPLNAFSRVIVGRYDRSSGIVGLVNLKQDIQASSFRVFI